MLAKTCCKAACVCYSRNCYCCNAPLVAVENPQCIVTAYGAAKTHRESLRATGGALPVWRPDSKAHLVGGLEAIRRH